jgi:hypothetical protein
MTRTEVPTPAARRARSLATLGTLALAVAGCQTPPPPPPPEPPPKPVVMEVHCAPAADEDDIAARHFIATQNRLSTLNTADLSTEANRPADPNSVQSQIDQALALGLTHTPGDLQRAQTLVDQVIHNTAQEADPWRGPARLLASMYADQRRADEQVEKTAQQLRDAQRESQRKLDQVNEKLEQLKAIERSLNTRPAGAAASKPGP